MSAYWRRRPKRRRSLASIDNIERFCDLDPHGFEGDYESSHAS